MNTPPAESPEFWGGFYRILFDCVDKCDAILAKHAQAQATAPGSEGGQQEQNDNEATE